MANMCYNSILVKGIKEDVQEFDEVFSGYHIVFGDNVLEIREGYSFQNIAPVNYKKVLSVLNSRVYRNNSEMNHLKDELIRDQMHELWGNYDISQEGISIGGKENLEMAMDGDCVKVRYSFYSRWNPNHRAISHMAEAFPELEFRFTYDEPGVELAGYVSYKDGCLADEKHCGATDDYREFMMLYLDGEYYMCSECGDLYEKYELDDHKEDVGMWECPSCESREILAPSHAKKRITIGE